MSRGLAGLLLALGLSAMGLPSWAEGAAGGACQADAKALCKDTAPGGGRIAACLQAHQDQLSSACQAQLPQMQQCASELKRLCGDAKPLALRRCMNEHKAELASLCQGLAPSR